MFLADDFKKIKDMLSAIEEADGAVSVDKTVDDLMTTKRSTVNKIDPNTVVSLAKDLDVDNPELFKTAFDSIRIGKMPSNTDQLKELAVAFDKILSGDAGTTSRVISELRDLYKDKDSDVVSENESSDIDKTAIKKLYKGKEGWVYQPTSAAGAKYLLQNTKSNFLGNNSLFDRYQELGPIYVVFDKSTRQRYTVQPAQHMAVDKEDHRVDMESLPSWSIEYLK